jgi:glycogen(starch) synthase
MKTKSALQIGMSGSASGGGLERYYFDLIRALPNAGIIPTGLVVGDADGKCDGAPAVSAFANSTDSMLKRWRKMRESVARHIGQADVVVSHFAPYAFPVLDKIRNKPLVVHFHGPWALEGRAEGSSLSKTALRKCIERLVYGSGARFITLSNAFADILANEYGVDRDKVRVIRGGVNISRFTMDATRRDARVALGWPINRRIVLSVRRLVPSKGLEGLIDAAVAVHASDPNMLVMILGSGPLKDALQARINALGASEYIHLLGAKSDDDLARAYRAADLTVVPSIAFEGFGLVVIESLASGTPVLVTDVGGLPETIRDLDSNLILGGSDAASISRGLAQVSRGELKLPDATTCIDYAKLFDWPVVATQIRDVYAEAAQ